MNGFYALLFRQKYIKRWGLMRNTREENLAEHSAETAMLAHSLALISNEVFGNSLNADRAVTLALFHDAPEVLTGDLPTPVKYYSEGMRDNYRKFESEAEKRLINELPEPLHSEYETIISHVDSNDAVLEKLKSNTADDKLYRSDAYLYYLVKGADRLSAYIKCIEEKKSGNSEFDKAASAVLDSIQKMHCRELDWFVSELLPAFSLTLDEL